MDVTLPDGHVITGVPDGMTQSALVNKLNANGIDTSWYKPNTAHAASIPSTDPNAATNNPIAGAVGDESKYLLDTDHVTSSTNTSSSDTSKPTGLMSLHDQWAKIFEHVPDPQKMSSVARGALTEASDIGRISGKIATAPVLAYDAIRNAITGDNDYSASEHAKAMFVKPWEDRMAWSAIKPDEKQSVLDQIGYGIGSMLTDLPVIMASGGASEVEGIAKAVPSTIQYLSETIGHGLKSMSPIMVKSGIEKAEQVLDKGGSYGEALTAGSTAALHTGFLGSAPMSLEGNIFQRLATGVPVGSMISEISRQIDNASSPDNMQHPFDWKENLVGAAQSAILAGAMGPRSENAHPTRIDLGYENPASVTVEGAPKEFDNVSPVVDKMQAIRPLKESPQVNEADVVNAPSVDDAIAAANKEVNAADIPVKESLTIDHIQPILDTINPRMSTGEVKVVPTMADLPENIKQRIDANGDPVEGVYTEGSGKVHLVADAFDNIDRVHQVLGHELVGHLAPTEIIDPKIYSNAVNSVIAMDKAGNANIRQLGEIVDTRQPGLDQHTRAKEIMAMAVENNSYKSSPVLRRVASDITYSVKKFLMSQGMDNGWVNKLSDHEVHSMLREGERRLYSGKTEKSISTPDIGKPQVAPMDESIKAMEPPKSEERIRPTSLFESSADYKVNTEDNGQLNVSVKRSKDGSVALFSDDGTIKEFNAEFAKDKTDADLLKYQYEPLGYKSHEEVNGNGSQEVSGTELKESFTAPAQINDKQAKQVSIAMPGIKAGDIVNAKGKHFTNKDTAKAVAKMAGPGWRVQPTKEGFVVRYRPATEAQIAASKASARARNSINTDTDSLHAAIAKLGGMNRDELVKVWGADPKEMANLRSGIKLVAPTKGMPIDRIADSLKELGYIGEDEHGKHDLNELMDHFFTELGGDKHYTKEGYERIAKEQEAILHEDYLAEKDIKDAEFAKLSEIYQKYIDERVGEFDDLTEEDNAKLQRELQEWEDWVTLNQHIIPDNADEELDSSGRRMVSRSGEAGSDTSRENPSNEDLYGPYEGSLRNQEEVRRTGSGSQGAAEEFGLKGQTEQEARAQLEQQAKLKQEQETKAKEVELRTQADADRDSFNLTGSDRKADVEAANGQQDLLAEPLKQKQTKKQKGADKEAALREHFTVGNIIHGDYWKSHDQVDSFDWNNGNWSVKVHEVKNVDGKWESVGPVREHRTAPSPKDQIVAKAELSPESQVEKAKKALDKAGVTGTDRTSTIAAVRRGDLTAQEVAESHKPAAKIEDFGEVIGGAKKDLWQTYQKAMSEELPVDAKNITLSKHFPEPNYEKLIEAGVDVKSLAAVKAMRDAIPTKPKRTYKVIRWADQVRLLREFANGLISGKSDINHVVESMRKIPALEAIASRIDMYSELGYPAFKNAKGYEITGGWQTPGNPGHTQFALQGEKLRKQYFATRDEAVNALKALLGIKSELNGANKKQISFDIYRITATGERIIGKKVAPGKYIDLKTGFKDAVEARAYLRENQENLEKLLESKKENPIIRKGVNDPRIGEDYRKGDHITSDEYKAEFGFRGTQFGNYVEQARRQKELNNSYDALRDMAKIIDIPSKAISLNGELAIAFGARGNGGPDPAAAHYEPGQVVINLTKKNGFGSLAHEWFHALDNYFGKSSQVHDYLTYANRYKEINPEAVRPEVADAFREVMNTIKDSDFYKRSVVIDKYRAKDYWSTNEELGARAFEAYIKAKAEAKGESNDYLANIIGEEGHAAFNSMQKDLGGEEKPYPYPTKAEQEKINPAFDKLFDSLQTKETDKGVALFSRKPATKEAYEKRIDELFNGKEADNRKGVRVLDRSDVLDILGYGGMPVNLAESKVILGIGRHKLKAADWKKVPEWIDNPVAVFDSDTKDGRLVFIPDDTIAGEPIKVILEPKSLTKGFDAHILINAYDAHSTMPTMRWFKEGLLRYIDNKKSQSLSDVSGLRLPNRHQLKTSSDKNLLRDRDLVNYRKENPETDVSDEGGTPLFSKRNKEDPKVEFDGQELGGVNQPIKQLTLKAREFARKHFADKTVTDSYGNEITIPWSGIKHTFSGKVSETAAIVATKLDKIIEHGKLINKEPDYKGRDNIKAVYTYQTPVSIAGKHVNINVIVREALDGRRFYDHYDADIAAPSGMSGDRIGTNQLQPTLGATSDKSEASNVSRNIVENQQDPYLSRKNKDSGEETTTNPAGGKSEELWDRARNFIQSISSTIENHPVTQDLLLKVAPMSTGSERARAIAKDFANADRTARWQWNSFDELLKKNFSKEQLKTMWEAADEENVLRQKGEKDDSRGLGRLDPKEREVVETLHQYGEELLQRAKEVGMFQGDGLPFWAPRMAVMLGDDGEYYRPPSGAGTGGGSGEGGNITTSSQNLKQRKYLTSEETEAAMKAKLGDEAKLVKNIRTMPLAMARLERAIAGRELVNSIKDLGTKVGANLVSSSEGPGFFTVDHPAFKTFKPRMVEEDGKYVPAVDQNGEMIFDRTPIYINDEFKGPLKAIMTDKPGAIYQGLMTLKAKAMGLIMYTPIIHNAVEWGRALPIMPGKVLTFKVYFEGNAIKNDPVQMRQAIKDGLVPIGHRAAMQDITGLMEDPTLEAGRSWTAKIAGKIADQVSEDAGQSVREGIDKAGDFWHNTLLWDRVGDLQAGIYSNLKSDLVGKGMDARSAGILAAHFANRFAGALPNEAMSSGARKIANFALFSRTFTLGNLGVLKDAITGLPADVKAQISRDAQELGMRSAKNIARKEAIGAIVFDMGLMLVGNSLLQDALNVMNGQSLDETEDGYVRRFKAYMNSVTDNPFNLVSNISQISSTADNEPGKENRIRYGTDSDGTGLYFRLPIGKIGEEFAGWLTSPLKTFQNKEGTIMRPLGQIWSNDKGLGQPLYDPYAKTLSMDTVKNAGRIAWALMGSQLPTDALVAAYDIARGKGDGTDVSKTVGPLVGITTSKGAPGGPAVGEMYDADRQYKMRVSFAMPDVKRALKDDDIDRAVELLQNAGMQPSEIRSRLKAMLEPESRLNHGAINRFEKHSTDEQKDRFSNAVGG